MDKGLLPVANAAFLYSTNTNAMLIEEYKKEHPGITGAAEAIMKCNKMSQLLRESIGIKFFPKMRPLDKEIRGWDAYEIGSPRRNAEIKSEQVGAGPCSGTSSWNGLSVAKVNRYQEENPIMIQTGFSGPGKLGYVARFDFNNSDMAEFLLKGLANGSPTSFPAPTWKYWLYAEGLEMWYPCGPKIAIETMNSTFLKAVDNLNLAWKISA